VPYRTEGPNVSVAALGLPRCFTRRICDGHSDRIAGTEKLTHPLRKNLRSCWKPKMSLYRIRPQK
jgi:hypothetical protein